MVNDSLSDIVVRIKNAYMAKRESVEVPVTRVVRAVVGVLVTEGYLTAAEEKGRALLLKLKYTGKRPAVTGIRRVSKPGGRVYTGVKELPKVWGGVGINILSTSKGVISGNQAKKLKAGGEIIAQVW